MEMDKKKKEALIILMKGHPGTGKTTLAKSIAASLHFPLLDKDDFRNATFSLSTTTTATATALNDFSYDALWRVVSTQVSLGLSVVVDSPLSRKSHLDTAVEIAGGSDRVVVVECRAGNLEEWRRRIERRGVDGGDGAWHKPVTWRDLECLLEGYGGCTGYDVGEVDRFIVDTTSGGGYRVLSSVLHFIRSHRHD